MAVLDEVDDGVLQNLRIHGELRYVGVVSEGAEDGVCDVADAALYREKLRGYSARLHLGGEKVGHIVAYFLRDGVAGLERGDLVGHVGSDNADDFPGVDLYDGAAYPVAGGVNGNLAAERGIGCLVYIMDAVNLLRLVRVELYQNFVGKLQAGGRYADGSGEENLAAVADVGGFDYRPVELAHEAVVHVLGSHRKVEVGITDLARICAGADVGVGLVWRAVAYRLGACEHALAQVARRGAGDDGYFKFPALRVLLFGLGRNGGGNRLCRARRGESAERDLLTVLDEARGLLRSEILITHFSIA